MMPASVDDEASAAMAMPAGPTVFTAEELAALALEEKEAQTQCTRRWWQTTARRFRSLSPSRRSPKLRHTNGRLEPVTSSPIEQPPKTVCLGQDAALWKELARLSTSTVATTECAGLIDPGDGEFVSKQGSFPAREEVKRCQSCLEPNRRSKQLYIFRRDQGFRQLCAQNTRRIIAAAKVTHDGGSNNNTEGVHADTNAASADKPSEARTEVAKPTARQQKLAMKALKYRKLLEPATGLDEKQLADPSFDVLEYLAWCKA